MGSLADRKRQLVRDELTGAALKLLAYQGFEETTIDQIAAAAGVSMRTFFRYFPSKEDVIIDVIGKLGEQARDTLAASPAGERPAVSLRRALGVFADALQAYPEKSLRLTRLTLGTPALRARYLDRQRQAQHDIAGVLTARGTAEPLAAVSSAVAFAAYETALEQWARCDGTEPLGDLLNRAFAMVTESQA